MKTHCLRCRHQRSLAGLLFKGHCEDEGAAAICWVHQKHNWCRGVLRASGPTQLVAGEANSMECRRAPRLSIKNDSKLAELVTVGSWPIQFMLVRVKEVGEWGKGLQVVGMLHLPA